MNKWREFEMMRRKRISFLSVVYAVLFTILAIFACIREAEACNGFYVREEVNAQHRICYYNHMGSEAAITQIVASICPTTVLFSHSV